MELVREHFFELVIGGVAVLVGYALLRSLVGWLRRTSHSGKSRVYCRHCNWEGLVTARKRVCGRCGSEDLGASYR